MLGGLEGDGDPCRLAELAGPHAGAVDDVLGFDIAERRGDAGDCAPLPQESGHGHPFEDLHPAQAGSLGERHRDVGGVGSPVTGDVEAGEDVVGAGEGEEPGDLRTGDLLHLDAAVAIEGGDPAVLLEPVRLGGQLDEPDRSESGGETGLGLEAGVEVPGVAAHLGRGLGRRAEGHDETGGVPRGAGGEPVPFQDDDIGPAEMGEVVGDAAPDDAAADDDHPGPARQARRRRSG